MAAPRESDLKRLVTAWADAGLDPAPIEQVVTPTLARIAAVRAEMAALIDGTTDRRDAIVDDLAAGRIDLAAAVNREVSELAEPVPTDQPARIRGLYEAVSNQLLYGARRTLRATGEAFIEDALAPSFDKLVTEAASLAATVDGLDDDAQAVAAGGKRRDAWGRLTDLANAAEAHVAALRALAAAAVIAPLADNVPPRYRMYRHPDQLPPGVHRRHPVRALLDAVTSGAEPRIATAAQAAADAAAAERGQPVPAA